MNQKIENLLGDEIRLSRRFPALIAAGLLVVALSGCSFRESQDTVDATPTADDMLVIVTPTVQATMTPRVELSEYTVQEGDTLLDIAIQFGVTIDMIIDANELLDPNALFAGQVLMIPFGTPVP